MDEYFIGPQRNILPAGSRELGFGLGTMAIGLLLSNVVLFGGFRLGFAVGAMASILWGWWYLHRSGHPGDGYTRTLLGLCLVIAAGFGWSADDFVKTVLFLFLVAGVNVAFCQMAGQNRFAAGSVRSLLDGVRGACAFGLGKMAPACRGVVVAFQSGSEVTRRSGAVLAGLALGLPAMLWVGSQLIFADAAFEGLMDLLPSFDLQEIGLTIFFGAGLVVFLYTRCVGLCHGTASTPEAKAPPSIPVLTMNTALGTVCAVYVAYLFSQLAYFVGGFSGILPAGYTAAEYARRGFFEMARLCAINLGLMTFGVGLVRREDRAPASTRGLCLFLGLVTEFLVAAGVAKMVLYIGSFGLTRLRVLTMVIMVFLAIATATVALWLYVPKVQYMKVVLVTALVIGAAVLWLDVDTQVANYNVDAYLSGKLDSLDAGYLLDLGPGSVEAIARLDAADDPDHDQWASNRLQNIWLEGSDDWRGISVIYRRAWELQRELYPNAGHPVEADWLQ